MLKTSKTKNVHACSALVPAFFVGLAAAAFWCCLYMLRADPYMFFADDYQAQFMPLFREAAHLLRTGHWPFITDRIWNGGAILGEYQVGILNPFSLAAIWGISFIANASTAAAVYSIFHYTIYAAGLYYLGRKIDHNHSAAIIGTVIASSSAWLFFWGAVDWIPALVSIAWLPWALAALRVVHQNSRYMPLGALATALPLLSGWPLTTLVMVMTLLVLLVLTGGALFAAKKGGIVSDHERENAGTRVAFIASTLTSGKLWPLAATTITLFCGILIAMPALLPAWLYAADNMRDMSVNSIWSTPIEVLLAIGIPNFMSVWQTFTGCQPLFVNYAYVAWFAPVLLLDAFFNRKETGAQDDILRWLCIATLGFFFLCQIPQIWNFRFNFRFLPYLHLAIGLLSGRLFMRSAMQPWKIKSFALGIAMPFFIAFCQQPAWWQNTVFFLIPVLALSSVTFYLRRKGSNAGAVLVAGQIILFYLMIVPLQYKNHLEWPTGNFHFQPVSEPQLELSLYSPQTSALDDGTDRSSGNFWANIPYGNFGLNSGRIFINGYSPVLRRPYVENFCFNTIGSPCPEISERLFSIDPYTHLPFIDLLKIQRVTALKGVYADQFEAAAANLWQRTGHADYFDTFTRIKQSPPLIGKISWTSEPLIAVAVSLQPDREAYQITSSAKKPNDLILARAWVPGMNATLNGKNLPLKPYRGLLPLIELPPDASGEFILSYWPAGLNIGICCAFIAFGVAVGMSLWYGGQRLNAE